jgi:quercetin dioxygenase-like cupin family protein
MRLRDDFTIREHVPFEDGGWTPSPEPSVERKMLERDGGEVARATSIVRYAKGSKFAEHVHERGEEFIVLRGTFSDEHGNYPAGTYVRNPAGSRHSPFSVEGCVLFVKLRQFDDDDHRQCVIDVESALRERAAGTSIALHTFESERVSIERLAEGATMSLEGNPRGTELFVVRGSLRAGSLECGPWTWLRSPGEPLQLSSSGGCVFWLKQGHLRSAHAP